MTSSWTVSDPEGTGGTGKKSTNKAPGSLSRSSNFDDNPKLPVKNKINF